MPRMQKKKKEMGKNNDVIISQGHYHLTSFPIFLKKVYLLIGPFLFLEHTVNFVILQVPEKNSVDTCCHFDKWLLYFLYFSTEGKRSSCRPGLLLIVIMVWTDMGSFIPGYPTCCTYISPVTAILTCLIKQYKSTDIRTPLTQPHTNIVYRSQTY